MSSRTTKAMAPSMAVRPRTRSGCCFWLISGLFTGLDSQRYQLRAPPFQGHARQRPRRRTLQHGAIPRREEAPVTGAGQPVCLPLVVDGTRKVRAFLTVGHIHDVDGGHQVAVFGHGGVMGDLYADTRKRFISSAAAD